MIFYWQNNQSRKQLQKGTFSSLSESRALKLINWLTMFFWQLHTGKTMTSVSWHQHESRVWDSYFKISGNSCLKRLFILVLHTVARTPLVGLTTCVTFFSFIFNICSKFFCLCFSGFLLSSLYDAFSRSPSSVTSTPMLHCWIFYKSSNFTFISSSYENILRQVF